MTKAQFRVHRVWERSFGRGTLSGLQTLLQARGPGRASRRLCSAGWHFLSLHQAHSSTPGELTYNGS